MNETPAPDESQPRSEEETAIPEVPRNDAGAAGTENDATGPPETDEIAAGPDPVGGAGDDPVSSAGPPATGASDRGPTAEAEDEQSESVLGEPPDVAGTAAERRGGPTAAGGATSRGGPRDGQGDAAGAEAAGGDAPRAGESTIDGRQEPGGDVGAGEPKGDDEEGKDGEEAGASAGAGRSGTWPNLLRAGTRSPAGLLIGLLIGLLGFALAVQVRSNTSTSGLSTARQEDLVRILDDLSSREDRLRRQIADLEAARSRLSTTGDRSSAALEEARKRSTTLGILAGTVAARGPGIQLTLTDPGHRLTAEDLLDAVEELRAAGAEAVQVGTVRIGLDSSFTAADRGIAVDGTTLTAPYTILAIGDPPTLATAMGIPGGVADTARRAGGDARIAQQDQLVVRALRSLREPQYSRPADGGR
jgi:uncharacterized protein YlxW (UPF0749 family)